MQRLECRIALASDTWTGNNHLIDNNWSDGANWSLLAPPGTGDTALFNSSASSTTVNVDAVETIAALTADSTWGGTINVNNALTVTGNFQLAGGTFGGSAAVSIAGSGSTWSGGTLSVGSGGFTNQSGGTLTVSGASNLVLDGGGTLTNDGTIDDSMTAGLFIENGSTLANASGATFNFTADGNISQAGGGPDVLNNSGLL
ncbi:MAG TPA: hypothetical protein VGX76_24015, partial [Pirellulales bacterium]|nr:hypothetical protein [Pirellulales bacterium]